MPPRALAVVFVALLTALPAGADTAGRFDYYVLALSWSPGWCAAEGDRQEAEQCAPGAGTGFLVHGLWPQHEEGWPQDCPTEAPDPSRADSAAMADLMGSGGLAWYQWRKHGRCSGLSGPDYYAATRAAAEAVTIPPVFQRLPRDLTVPVGMVEDAFIDVNPDLSRDGITVTCKGGALREIRICLTRDLNPRPCAADARRDCRAGTMRMEAVR